MKWEIEEAFEKRESRRDQLIEEVIIHLRLLRDIFQTEYKGWYYYIYAGRGWAICTL